MTNYIRFIALALLTACTGAEKARATTASSEKTATAAATPAAIPPAAASAEKTDPLVARADSARIRGSANAKVWMIIASDFQCPYCRMWHDSADMTIRREYIDNGKVRLAFINYPIGNHQNAMPAAEHAMCAAAQNKFWEMHDALFGAQDKWVPLPDPSPVFADLAAKAGVDVNALKACVSSHKMRALIEADHEKAVRAGVRATPSFFIGNQLLEGVQMPADLRKVLDAAIASAK
ncbi:MAG TPA: thioredoxin domain-containing protein [Gemmatimonadaceae bacterium]|nr:thioredoxin domain-containing protein [Gemmatimonadaceae bacterium]